MMPGDLQEMPVAPADARENMSRDLARDMNLVKAGSLRWHHFDSDDANWISANLAEHAEYLKVFGHLGKTPDEVGNLINSQYDSYEAKIEQLEEQIRKLKHEHQPSDNVPGTDKGKTV